MDNSINDNNDNDDLDLQFTNPYLETNVPQGQNEICSFIPNDIPVIEKSLDNCFLDDINRDDEQLLIKIDTNEPSLLENKVADLEESFNIQESDLQNGIKSIASIFEPKKNPTVENVTTTGAKVSVKDRINDINTNIKKINAINTNIKKKENAPLKETGTENVK